MNRREKIRLAVMALCLAACIGIGVPLVSAQTYIGDALLVTNATGTVTWTPSPTATATVTPTSTPTVTPGGPTNTPTFTVTPTPTMTAIPVVGNVASNTADAGNPVKVGCVYNSTPVAVTTGKRVDCQATSDGSVIVASDTVTTFASGTAITSAAYTTAQNVDLVNPLTSTQEVQVLLHVTVASGTGGLTLVLRNKMPDGTYLAITGNPTAVTATGYYVYSLVRGSTGVGTSVGASTVTTAGITPSRNWNIIVAVGDASSYTYDVQYLMHG